MLRRLRYKLSVRDLAEMFLVRGFSFTHETVREWEERFTPLLTERDAGQRGRRGGSSVPDRYKAEWTNSHLIRGNVAEEVSALKRQDGQDILVGGSATLTRTLMQHGLVDVYRLLVYPIVLGKGKRLFPEGHRRPLRLIDIQAFSSGVVALTYQPAAHEGAA